MPLCGVALALALVVAAYTDLRWRIIPDSLNIAIAVTAPLAWWAQGLNPWPDMALQIGIGAGLFLFFLLQFQFNVMGGGDVKLGGALALWIAPSLIVEFVLAMAIAGALLSVLMMANLKLRGEPVFAGGFRLRLPDDDREDGAGQTVEPETAATDHLRIAPYGLAIAVGGWWVIHQQYLNHFLTHRLN